MCQLTWRETADPSTNFRLQALSPRTAQWAVSSSMRSASILVRTGVAKDFDEAMNIITAGFQNGLDPAATGRLEQLIRTLSADGTPVLFTSHDLGQVRRLADHCLFLSHGRLAAEGPLPDFLDDPPAPALAAFLSGALV